MGGCNGFKVDSHVRRYARRQIETAHATQKVNSRATYRYLIKRAPGGCKRLGMSGRS